MLASDPSVGPGKRHQGGCASCGGCEGGMRELRACAEKKPSDHKADRSSSPSVSDSSKPDLEQMKTWKVVVLRSFVRKLPGFPMTANEIRYANKASLLDALATYYNK